MVTCWTVLKTWQFYYNWWTNCDDWVSTRQLIIGPSNLFLLLSVCVSWGLRPKFSHILLLVSSSLFVRPDRPEENPFYYNNHCCFYNCWLSFQVRTIFELLEKDPNSHDNWIGDGSNAIVLRQLFHITWIPFQTHSTTCIVRPNFQACT